MKKVFATILLAACLLTTAASLLAQTSDPAPYTLEDLKKYGLIIWLPDGKRGADYYKSKGNAKMAAQLLAKADQQNRALVGYFKQHFNFCRVYFYYTSLEEDLKNGLPVLLNGNLQPDASITLPEKLIVGGFYYKDNQAHYPFPSKQFRVENADINMKLPSESWRPFWLKKVSREVDVIRLNKKLTRMAGG